MSTSAGSGDGSGSDVERLRDLGWDPSGGKAFTQELTALREAGYRPGPAAISVLSQVSGLYVTRPARPPKRKPRTFHFDVTAVPPMRWLSNVDMAGIDADDELCLVGELTSERMFLAVDTKGNIYAGNGTRLYLLGGSVRAALETLMSHTGPDDWTRVAPHRIPPWQVLVKADPPREVTTHEEAAALALAAPNASQGPVIGVADLGDVWRVFRSEDSDLRMPPLVPLLVSKSTGDVLNDLPLRQEGPSAQDGFADLIARLDPHLREWGFTGSRPTWRYRVGGDETVLKFEKYRASRAGLMFQFCLLRGGADVDPRPSCWSSTTIDGEMVQFHVLAGVPVDAMVDAVLATLRNEAMPSLHVQADG